MPVALIVEDDVDLRELFRTTLEMDGFDILEASSARDAIRLLESQTPDVAFIDLNMPQEPGTAVLAYIKRTPGLTGVKTIIVTANTRASSQVEELGADLFLLKPVSIDEMSRMAHRLIGTKPLRS